MSERIELYTTPKGGEHTAPTEDAKKAAWEAAKKQGVEGAKMTYGTKTGVYALVLPEGTAKKDVTAIQKATKEFRTPEAQAELAEQLPTIKAEAAAAREAKAAEGAEKPAKEAKEAKEPEAPRVGIDIYPLAPQGEVTAKEGESAEKAGTRTANAEMASDVRAKAAEAGIDNVAVAYHPKNQRWEIGVRGASEKQIADLTDAVSAYRTDEAKAAWAANAPERPASKGKEEGPDVAEQAAAQKGGAER